MGYPQHGQPYYGQKEEPILSSLGKDSTLAMLCHLSTFLGYSLVPIVGFVVGPLVVWMFTKENSPLVDHHGREALNFQINMLFWYLVAGVLCLAFIGFLLLPMVFLYSVIITVIASIKAASGEYYRYPMILRLV